MCIGESFRKEEAVGVLSRALKIRQEMLGAEDTATAATLYELGLAVWELGSEEEAVELLARALEIQEARLGPDDLMVKLMGRGMR